MPVQHLQCPVREYHVEAARKDGVIHPATVDCPMASCLVLFVLRLCNVLFCSSMLVHCVVYRLAH